MGQSANLDALLSDPEIRAARRVLSPFAVRYRPSPGGTGVQLASLEQGGACSFTGQWARFPAFRLVDATYKGWGATPFGMGDPAIHHFFNLVLEIHGELSCDCNGQRSNREVSLRVNLPIQYTDRITLLDALPLRYKLWYQIIRGLITGERLLLQFMEKEELIRFLASQVDPFLKLVDEAAPRLCDGMIDIPLLQQQIQQRIDQMAEPEPLMA